MIASNFQTPKKSLFVIGGNILGILKLYQFESINPIILLNKYNSEHETLSFSYLIFGLDWLFITGYIILTDTGDIKLCN
ncbi:ABC-three component system middle component 6 [Shewanella sp. GutDb-MelDb]|uniref:ABC-three component system middle component 6 n=1 Tax=Shewanella sp. GutDb-MelDb TaxID=2058316 RepID=UPI000C7B6A32|nr:ABC-three component system middle component 6 [Shewanella sp. GutDb-MelDb]PKG55238.1 hypothetical protein CXF82_20635 [Shewanella sp. GutDb-MelDb]